MNHLAVVVGMFALAGCGEAIKSGHDGTTDPTIEITDTYDEHVEDTPRVDSVPDTTPDPAPDPSEDTASDPAGEPTGNWRHCRCYDIHDPNPDREPIWTDDVCVGPWPALVDVVEEIQTECEATLDTWCNCDPTFCTPPGEPCYE